jgi:hypothetical protein
MSHFAKRLAAQGKEKIEIMGAIIYKMLHRVYAALQSQ